jgi:hypothetical protein
LRVHFRRVLFPALALATLLAPWEARLSQMIPQIESLSTLVARSAVIAVARRTVKPAPDPENRVPSWKKPQEFKVTRVLLDRRRDVERLLKGGEKIQVWDADEAINQSISDHIAKHGYMGVPSVVRPVYSSSLAASEYEKDPELILFLVAREKAPLEFRFVMEGSYEAPSMEKQILEELGKTRPR